VPHILTADVPREPIDFGRTAVYGGNDAVIAPAVTVHIDAIGKTLHEPHLRFIGGAVHDDTGVQGFDS
jgi:hypothetical protein